MRPIDKGNSPQIFTNYQDAKQPLINRLGPYCSYCERRIPTTLAVEHILPKDEDLAYAHLRNEWSNFLLGCVNCNSIKGTKIVAFDEYLFPDRDNTFPFFTYLDTGLVEAAGDDLLRPMAQRTIELVGLDRTEDEGWDDTQVFSALERAGQRQQAWELARDTRSDFDAGEINVRGVSNLAAATGFFSVWMAAFHNISQVKIVLIQIFAHTAPDCFDANGNFVTPRPANGLDNSGKA